MALLHDLAETYLTACAVEGKAHSTIRGYRESLTRLQETGARLDFPAEVEAFTVQHVYAFLGALRERGASRAYQHRPLRKRSTPPPDAAATRAAAAADKAESAVRIAKAESFYTT